MAFAQPTFGAAFRGSQAVKTQREALEESKRQSTVKAFADSLEKGRTDTEAVIKQFTDLAAEQIENGATPEQLEPTRKAVQQIADSFTGRIAQLQAMAVQEGQDPALLDQLAEFGNQQVQIFEESLSAASLRTPGAVGQREGEQGVAEAERILGRPLSANEKIELAGVAPSKSLVTINNQKAPVGFQFKEDGRSLEPIPGGPQDTLTPEQAAKVQLLESAVQSSSEFQSFIIKQEKDPTTGEVVETIDRTNIANMNIGTPFTEGRSANVLLLDTIEAKLRAESGAAVPQTEVKRAGKRFRPSLLDSDETIRIKLNLMSRFVEGAFNKSQRDGRFDVKATVDAIEAAADEELGPLTEDEDEARLEKLGFGSDGGG